MSQKAADDVKSMLQDLEAHMTKKHDDTLPTVGAVMAQQHGCVDERIKSIEREITAIKSAVTAAGQALLRAPPGYTQPSSINMKDAYAARDGCGAACRSGCGGTADA